MGQQQLLLLVLGIVIVGLAVVAGINAFSENQKKSNKDALVTEAFRLATDAQAWKLKPEQYGGGGNDWQDKDNNTFDFADLDVSASNLSTTTNANDTYQTPWGNVTASVSSGVLTLALEDQNTNAIGNITVSAEGDINFAESGS